MTSKSGSLWSADFPPYMGIAHKGGGGVKACQDGLGHFFSTFARLTEEGVYLGNAHRNNTFQKWASLTTLSLPR